MKALLADLTTPVALFQSLRRKEGDGFLFESVERSEILSRYSFLGVEPYQKLIYSKGKTILRNSEGESELDGTYFDALKSLTRNYRAPELPGLPRFTGGAVGYSSYDTVRDVEPVGNRNLPGIDTPDAIWVFYDKLYAFDHVKHQLLLIRTIRVPEGMRDEDLRNLHNEALKDLDEMERAATRGSTPNESESKVKVPADVPAKEQAEDRRTGPSNEPRSNLTKDEFVEMVGKAKRHIHEGDIFQVVLSQRIEADFDADPFLIYRALRVVNPSPYLFYMDFEGVQWVGSSPEILVQVMSGVVRVLPIAGTRPRGATPEEDHRLEVELLADPKELAEHTMLIDLGRNDVSRVSEPGSVQMARTQVIERFSHVMHIVSDVQGLLHPDLSPVDALMHCFPAGTVTGAPKVRAMQIIEDLEPSRRGTYAGAVGYFDHGGNMDTCIAIRTMVVKSGKVYIQAGAGIVADSDPEMEWKETRHKAGALLSALELARTLRESSSQNTGGNHLSNPSAESLPLAAH